MTLSCVLRRCNDAETRGCAVTRVWYSVGDAPPRPCWNLPTKKVKTVVTKKTSHSSRNTAPDHPPLVVKKAARSKAPGRRVQPTDEAGTSAPARRAPTRRKRPTGPAPAEPEAFAPQVEVSDEDIRIRAYYLHLEHRGSGRSDIELWLLAERELRALKTPRG